MSIGLDTARYEFALALKLLTNFLKSALFGLGVMALTSNQANSVTPLTLIARAGTVVNPILKKYRFPSAICSDASHQLGFVLLMKQKG